MYCGSLLNRSVCVQVSTCPSANGLRLNGNWAWKSGLNVAGQSVSCGDKFICRSSPTDRILVSAAEAAGKESFLGGDFMNDVNSRDSYSEARVSNVEETSWCYNIEKQDYVNADANSAKNLNGESGGAALSSLEKAWDHWNKLGAPKLIVAPMMDQSELPFRMLCRKYGATAAYTPMFHSRPFALQPGYRRVEFTTCPLHGRRIALFVQFGANDPKLLVKAAMFVQEDCDYFDINLGCPQRVAKRGFNRAFLMDDLPLIQSMVTQLVSSLTTPVSCKIRTFPDLEDTLAYAHMLENAGCSLLGVHGRTRDQKDGRTTRADWEAIKAVKEAVRIPVLANGNIRWLEDVHECIRMTGVDGVLYAESLLENPALFSGHRMRPVDAVTGGLVELSREGALNEPSLVLEYLELSEKYPIPQRMMRSHVYKMPCAWSKRYPELRDELNFEQGASID
uniref:DUS-like FMN-binding domain-containing protein n=1 Tax=Physcomitrium patens TaxID=3218 RepID=A0A2K1K8Q7_PHYPA|nr:hypothetical protein PHYPA_012054 [Physcomitrium patens]